MHRISSRCPISDVAGESTVSNPATAAELGQRAEELAVRWLRRRRVQLVQRNYRCRQGEIDIIAIHRNILLFVEVRLRSSAAWGGSAASVQVTKQRRIICTAEHFLQANPPYCVHPCRFDVICAGRNLVGRVQVTAWIRDAFRA